MGVTMDHRERGLMTASAILLQKGGAKRAPRARLKRMGNNKNFDFVSIVNCHISLRPLAAGAGPGFINFRVSH